MYAWPDGGENQIASLPPAHPTHRLQHLAKVTHTLHICLTKLEFWLSALGIYQRLSILDLLKLSASDQNWTDCSTNTAGACTQFSLADEPTRCQNYLQEYIPLGLKKISPFSFQSLCEVHKDYKCTYRYKSQCSAEIEYKERHNNDQFCCDLLPRFDLSKAEDRPIGSKS